MCCNNFVGDTPFLNKQLNSFQGGILKDDMKLRYDGAGGILKENCNGAPCASCAQKNNAIGDTLKSYSQQAGVQVSTGFQPTATTTETTTQEPKKDWVGTLLPYADKIFGIKRAPEEGSSFSTDPNLEQEKSSTKALWYVAGVIIALIVIFVIIKVAKKGK